jgi:hypothetical protein
MAHVFLTVLDRYDNQLFPFFLIMIVLIQNVAASILNSNNASSSSLADALTLYIQTTANAPSNVSNIISPGRIDQIMEMLVNITVASNLNSSFLMVQPVDINAASTAVGASFQRNVGGGVVRNNNMSAPIDADISVGAIINTASLAGITSLKMLIIDKPVTYQNSDNSSDSKSLASSVIVAAVEPASAASNTMVTLYFQVSSEYTPNVSATYLCSYFDTTNSQWSEVGCGSPIYNSQYNRYECNCSHLTSFALIWLPQTTLGTYGPTLQAQDIASLVFQSISIVCFLAIIIHALAIRFINPLMHVQANDLLPLISCASTTLLFIFYIALGMTVYTGTTSSSQTQCFLSSSVLMFFVYFLLIFMFCAKTSVGYFNYLRFVYLFPQPSFRRLYILLIISFFLSIGWTSFAAGFNSSPSYNITQLYPYKLCWFTRNVLYYFLTIPVCIFLLLNLLTIIFVAKHIINHARNATSPHQSYERMKRCVLVLLSSCVTQGIGWLFGPFISFVSPTGGDVLSWIFIVLNGLEGLWSILLYIIIRSQRIDEQKRVSAAAEITRTSSISENKYKDRARREERRRRRSSTRTGDIEIVQRNVRREPANLFHDLGDNGTINWPMSENDSSSL